MSDDPVIDTSRVDNYLRSRHRVEVLNAAWKPALAGAAGALAIIGSVALGAWLVGPRYRYNEVEIPRVVLKDVLLNNPVPRDVPFDVPVPRGAPPPPIAADPSPPPDAPKTPTEKKLADTPNATVRGRIVKSVDGKALSVAGKNYWPALWDEATHTWAEDGAIDTTKGYITDPYIGEYAVCAPFPDRNDLIICRALHNGREVDIDVRPVSDSTPTRGATNMVTVNVDVGSGAIEAEVDTGCSWPLSMPENLADTLVKQGLAFRAGSTKSLLADGTEREVEVVMINSIEVEGRVLKDVEAVVSPNSAAPVLLGLGALNRLGGYKFENGGIVFTSEQPT